MTNMEKVFEVGRSSECLVCGKTYAQYREYQIYCSSACRSKAFYTKSTVDFERITIQNATEEQIREARRLAAIKAMKKLPMNKCAHCDKFFQPTRTWQKYCCEKHREADRKRDLTEQRDRLEKTIEMLENENEILREVLKRYGVPYDHLLTDTSQTQG